MKKIIIIDGGPRRNMNTAQMLQKSNVLGREMYAWGKRPGDAAEGLYRIAAVDTIDAGAWKAGWKLRF